MWKMLRALGARYMIIPRQGRVTPRFGTPKQENRVFLQGAGWLAGWHG